MSSEAARGTEALRLVDDLIWALRRGGLQIATSQAIDAARAAAAAGLADRETLREALACVVVGRARERRLFDRAFDAFFERGAPRHGTLLERLASLGFAAAEIDAFREALEAIAGVEGSARFRALAGGGDELFALLTAASVRAAIEQVTSPLVAAFHSERVAARAGMSRARDVLGLVRVQLKSALGAERGDALADALERELIAGRTELREHVERFVRAREELAAPPESARPALAKPFFALSDAEIDEVRRAVRGLAERLRGAARVRERHAARGRIDARRTMRASLRTGGVPFAPVRRRRSREKPRLVVLCDVSDSVRNASRFMLELVHAMHELFARTRSFVFVGEIAETTLLFESEPAHVASERVHDGSVVELRDHSSYGRAFAAFEARAGGAIDRRTTVVVLGDGRTNRRADGVEVVARLRARARHLIWICPEPKSSWGMGDSAMPRYARVASEVSEVRAAIDLERVARSLVARR